MKLSLVAALALLVAPPLLEAQTPEPSVVVALTFGSGEHVRGSGRIVDDQRPLPGFIAVHATGPVDVQLKASDHDGVTVRADDNVAPLIETRVIAGDRPTLQVGVKADASFRTSRTPVVVVEFRALSELVIRGSGDVSADRITAEDFALSMSGSGDVRVETLQAKRLAAVLSGSGDLVVGGRADQQAFRIAGSGDVRAARLEGRSVQVAIAGSGDATVSASEALDVTIAGSGDVSYWGSPRVTQVIRGTGSVHRAR